MTPGADSVNPTWLTAFVDLPRAEFRGGVKLMRRLTGYDLSKGRGADREFATLVPPAGDPFLRVQRLGDGRPRIHLDVHVANIMVSRGTAERLGATVVRPAIGYQQYVVMRSPGGMPFCLVGSQESVRPPASAWPGGHHSLVDQVSLDVPFQVYDAEVAFWEQLTGWRARVSPAHPELAHLVRPEAIPLRILLQRLEEPTGVVRAHLDWATDDRLRETERHQQAGSVPGAHRNSWTVMHGPPRLEYCITDRHPGVGR